MGSGARNSCPGAILHPPSYLGEEPVLPGCTAYPTPTPSSPRLSPGLFLWEVVGSTAGWDAAKLSEVGSGSVS